MTLSPRKILEGYPSPKALLAGRKINPWYDGTKRPDVTRKQRPIPSATAWGSAIESAEVARLALKYLRQELQRSGRVDCQDLVNLINEAEQRLAPLAQSMRIRQRDFA